MTGPKRTWQQVKIKYKNILQNAVKKKTHKQGTGGGSPSADLTPAEDRALELNRGRPVLEGIPGGTDSNINPSQEDASLFIKVSGNTISLLEPPTVASPIPEDDDPGEGTSGAADEVDEETVSLDSRRFEDPDALQDESQPCNINSQAIRQLYATHLKRQIQLADLDIEYKRRQMADLSVESEIKRRKLRKLNLEIKKLERELQEEES
ncbi:uncharacterized protein LOC125889801 isoform X2 [Epinephelus fuscoguttatus]|uniref:uncharacterized protein LOC125889801 isoform X2 n=1 Tax=Epinephelus fuscoguttatus TaxID=293821 RepID=UPI0020CFEB94|nr:uncharacterized protein LOC125889801 isoform X2 [Epinephelus fuscoguttatus]